MKAFVVLVFMLLSMPFSAISAQGDVYDWLIMIYVDGDEVDGAAPLENDMIDDIIEMEKGLARNREANIKIVVEFDGCYSYPETYIFEILPSDPNKNDVSSKIEDGNIGEQNMGDPNTLINFVRWATDKYPSHRQALILEDHGEGWLDLLDPHDDESRAICADSNPENDELTIEELGMAIRRCSYYCDGNIELLGFDACMMQMLEVLSEHKNCCSYQVGSQEVESTKGWNYEAIIGELAINSLTDEGTLAETIVNNYTGKTLSAVQMSSVQAVEDAVSFLSMNLMKNLDGERDNIEKSRDECERYRVKDFKDLCNFVDVLSSKTGNEEIKESCQLVNNTIDGAVIANHNAVRPNSNGISIWFPKPNTAEGVIPRYTFTRFGIESRWDELLTKMYGVEFWDRIDWLFNKMDQNFW